MTRRVTGPWHPPSTPLEELLLLKRQLERGRLEFPTTSLVTTALLVVVCGVEMATGPSLILLAVDVALILAAVATSAWLIERWHKSHLEWLQAIEALNHYERRPWDPTGRRKL